MGVTRTFHSATDRCAAIRRVLDARCADPGRQVRITIAGAQVTLDGTVDAYPDKEAAVDAALLAGEAEVVVDRVAVRSATPRPAAPR